MEGSFCEILFINQLCFIVSRPFLYFLCIYSQIFQLMKREINHWLTLSEMKSLPYLTLFDLSFFVNL